ncbi:hypothetical protein [Ovoidimarina sediminis]|uniref:hypothetical protein n=1 Tax=Ovoidimarina sediminis TaxID=3079856 RepID=UPI00290811E7|nr:hypothetical protein [Rhodophyticola sp. MJ-SS7]MDU8943186.1 hypothetical protein [Rhodophyticola sp. MJ-SS7]
MGTFLSILLVAAVTLGIYYLLARALWRRMIAFWAELRGWVGAGNNVVDEVVPRASYLLLFFLLLSLAL